MKNFSRALRMASRYWMSLVLAAACSFAVAALWGANIGAFYPILEVTIRGKSTQQWMDEEIGKRDAAIASLELALAEQRKQLRLKQIATPADVPPAVADSPAAENPTDAERKIETAIADLQSQLTLQQTQRQGYTRMQPWIDRFVPSTPFNTIALIVVALVVSTLIKHIFLISNEVLVGRVALDITRTLRDRIFSRALRMDRMSFASHGNATFVTLIIQTTDMLSLGLMSTLGAALREPLKIVACLAGAAFICWRLLILSMLVAPVVGVLLFFLTGRIKVATGRVLERATGFHEVLLEALGNIQTVQAFRREECEQQRFEEATLLMKKFGLKLLTLGSLSKPIIEFLGIGMLGTTIIGGAYLVLNQQTHLLGIRVCDEPLSVSALLVFFGMLIGISDPLRKLSAVYSMIYSGTIAANAIFPMLDAASTIADPEEPQAVPRPHRKLAIDGVSFAYNPNQPVLDQISLEIPYGSTIGIIGSNGSGKSTLINLLGRFYDPQTGGILLDDVDYRQLKVEDVRSRFALVNQHTELFNDTIAYNIRYGNPEASDEEVERVAREAHAHEFISTALEDGYQTKVGQNGNRLSGGQRQRIALAR
ncbi:MAG: ABC transporter ATP-binding protein, partial [Planctomycetales bacterium]|nr:ABC transporter ATP-binding protein [Planctomycetales bacterium]